MKISSIKTWGLIGLIMGFLLSASNVYAQAGRNVSEYNLTRGVGLKGFDPVSFFPEGGAAPTAGNQSISYEHLGVTYLFTTVENRELFISNPDKYEPTYGGFCAYAMASGSKVDIRTEFYTINGNRLHFFVSARAKRNFDRDVASFEERADGHWMQISGESPRF